MGKKNSHKTTAPKENIPIIAPEIKDLPQLFRKNSGNFSKLLKKIKAKPPKNIDEIFEELHDEAFEKIDCLHCANCCKTTSPLLTNKDTEKLADFFSMRPADFNEKYIKIDEDGDYVFRQTPCPFLMNDNYCAVYDVRPKACAGYPHTDRKNQTGLFDKTALNAGICPAVYGILEKLTKIMNEE